MIKSIVDLKEKEDRILNVIKAQRSLKNKSQAIAFLTMFYAESFLEPELNPDYLKKLKRIEKEKATLFKDIDDLRKKIEG